MVDRTPAGRGGAVNGKADKHEEVVSEARRAAAKKGGGGSSSAAAGGAGKAGGDDGGGGAGGGAGKKRGKPHGGPESASKRLLNSPLDVGRAGVAGGDAAHVSAASVAELKVEMAALRHQLAKMAAMAMGGAQPQSAVAMGELTFEEKRELSQRINQLEADKLAKVIQIIAERMPLGAVGADDNIEIDIDTLEVTTLRRLQRYVKVSSGVSCGRGVACVLVCVCGLCVGVCAWLAVCGWLCVAGCVFACVSASCERVGVVVVCVLPCVCV